MALAEMNGGDHDWRPLADFLAAEIGYVLGREKYYLLERACVPLMDRCGVTHPAGLITVIRNDARIWQDLVNAVTINESFFFRDENLWKDLGSRVFSELLEDVGYKKRLDILSCACSSGQEVCTLAIVIREVQNILAGIDIRIVATDIDTSILERAQQARYSAFEVQRGLSPERLQRWFDPVGSEYQLKPGLLDNVRFERLNLQENFNFGQRFDLVFCRNVLIYFDVPGKKRILARLANFLNNYGFLALGGAETTLTISDDWEQRRIGNTTFYQKVY